MTQENIKKQIFITAILLIAVILIFQFTHLDVFFQSFFFNFETKTWIVDEKDYLLDLIFYSGFKKLFITFSVCLLLIVILSSFKKIDIIEKYKKGLIIVLLSTILVPLLLVTAKYITNMPCPCDTVTFGGNYPDIKVFEFYPKEFIQESRIKCWPAGHATMGFSLMALFYLFKKRRNKNIALVSSLIIGFCTGTYKVLVGDHFVSHTIITMLSAWLIILLIVRFIESKEKYKT